MRKTKEITTTERVREIPRRVGRLCLQFSQITKNGWSTSRHAWRAVSASQEAQGLPFEAPDPSSRSHTDEVLSIIVRKNDIAQEHDCKSIHRPRRVMIERTEPT